MKLWLAGSDINKMKEWLSYGVFEGVLTNPDVIANSGVDKKTILQNLCDISNGPVFYQLKTDHEEKMLEEAEEILNLDKKMKIKVPASGNGIRVMAKLSQNNHSVLATCVPDLSTLLFSIRFGAKWVTPYGSLWNSYVQVDKEGLISELQSVIEKQSLPAELIVGVSSPHELRRFTLLGVSSFFIWVNHLPSFFDLPMVLKAEEAFAGSWQRIEKKRL